MRVRCGACRTQFDVAGAGRYACPVCGSVNVVRNGAGAPQPTEPPGQSQAMGGYPTGPGVVPGGPPMPPPPPPEPAPMPKIECPECGFSFIVGLVPKVVCPMCSAEVDTGIEDDDTE
jgi:DNA-directed RNA polymerase subunit RPC12/RpoP